MLVYSSLVLVGPKVIMVQNAEITKCFLLFLLQNAIDEYGKKNLEKKNETWLAAKVAVLLFFMGSLDKHALVWVMA